MKRPKVINDLLAVDDTGTVANYIRQLEAELSGLRELTVRADSYLSLLWHRPSQQRDVDLAMNVERTIGDLRKASARAENESLVWAAEGEETVSKGRW